MLGLIGQLLDRMMSGRKPVVTQPKPRLDWFEKADDDRRNDIVHELLHLVHRDQTEVIRCGLQDAGYLPDKAFTMMWRMFELHTEAMIDHLAGVLAPSMPPAP